MMFDIWRRAADGSRSDGSLISAAVAGSEASNASTKRVWKTPQSSSFDCCGVMVVPRGNVVASITMLAALGDDIFIYMRNETSFDTQ